MLVDDMLADMEFPSVAAYDLYRFSGFTYPTGII
jgi:hypothetical protein